jgi:hypothetical protein
MCDGHPAAINCGKLASREASDVLTMISMPDGHLVSFDCNINDRRPRQLSARKPPLSTSTLQLQREKHLHCPRRHIDDRPLRCDPPSRGVGPHNPSGTSRCRIKDLKRKGRTLATFPLLWFYWNRLTLGASRFITTYRSRLCAFSSRLLFALGCLPLTLLI